MAFTERPEDSVSEQTPTLVSIAATGEPRVFVTVDDTVYAINGHQAVEMPLRHKVLATAVLQLALDSIRVRSASDQIIREAAEQ